MLGWKSHNLRHSLVDILDCFPRHGSFPQIRPFHINSIPANLRRNDMIYRLVAVACLWLGPNMRLSEIIFS